MVSILNFYILIYSFKPNSDVFGCLGIAILIHALLNKIIMKNNIIILLMDLFFFDSLHV